MHPSDLSGDLYDLAILVHVHKTGSFSRTAAEVGVNQSAVSYTVNKLRKRFDDPLFTRIGLRIEATERCDELAASAEGILGAFEELRYRRHFDIRSVQARVTVACNDYERQIIIPPFLRRAQDAAPGLQIDLVPSTSQGDTQLKLAQTDLLIGPLRPNLSGFLCRTLMSDHYVCVMSRANPLAAGALSLADYVSCRHATVTYGDTWKSRYLVELEAMGKTLNEVVSTPSPAGLPDLIEDTAIVATVPSRLAERMRDRLAVVASPVPTAFDIDLIWTDRTNRSELHRWIRDELVAAARAAQVRES